MFIVGVIDMDNILLIIIIILISLGVFWLIKSVCKPISTLTAVLLVIPTVLTCGVVLFIYRAFKNSYVSSSSNISSSNKYSTDFYDVNDNSMGSEDKKPARAYDDGFGKTTYYDKEGNLMGASLDNGFGKETFTDSEGNYVGSSFDNGLGSTTYTGKDGKVVFSNTNYLGDENFSDGTVSRKDSSSKYYS